MAVGAPLLPVAVPAIPVPVNVFSTAPPPLVLVVELPVGLVKSLAVFAATVPISDQAPIVPVYARGRNVRCRSQDPDWSPPRHKSGWSRDRCESVPSPP